LDLVTVILIAENSDDIHVQNSIKNVFEQTHKNIDLIVSSIRDLDTVKEKCKEISLNIRFIKTDESVSLFNEALKLASADIIFYKTVNNIMWFPRHIAAHLEDFANNKHCKYALGHCEYRNVDIPDHPLNTIGFRISNPPKIEEICLDEICHFKDVEVDWNKCVEVKDGQPLFMPGLVLKQWAEKGYRGCIPAEITVVQWVKFGGGKQQMSLEDIAKQIGAPKSVDIKEEIIEKDDDIEIKRTFPTLMGNAAFTEHNNRILDILKQTSGIVDIGISRVVGIGDILLCEPIVKKLRQKYEGCKITFYTAKPEIVEYFAHKPDEIVKIDDKLILEDHLNNTNHQLKISLDLSYESSKNKLFIDSYARTADITFNNPKDKYAELDNSNHLYEDFSHLKPYVVVVADGSGWGGKTLGQAKYKSIIEYLQKKGHKVIEPGLSDFSELTDSKYHKVDLKTLLSLIKHSEFFLGGDNGPIHIARSFNIPSIAINGAASTYLSNANREYIYYIQNNALECISCKHSQFFNLLDNGGLTFIPKCVNTSQFICMSSIEPEHVIAAIDKFLEKPKLMIDNSKKSKFYFNIPGSQYYVNEELDFIQKNDYNIHIDQEKNISDEYSFRWQEVFNNHSKPNVLKAKQYKNSGSFIDIGANCGLVVKAAIEEGYDAVGVDINKPSIDKGLELFPELKNKLLYGSFELFTDKKFDILFSDQVIEHTNPLEFLNNCKNLMHENSLLFIGCPNFRCIEAQEHMQRWQTIGKGEHVWLPTPKAIEYLLNLVNLEYEYLQDIDKGFFIKCKLK